MDQGHRDQGEHQPGGPESGGVADDAASQPGGDGREHPIGAGGAQQGERTHEGGDREGYDDQHRGQPLAGQVGPGYDPGAGAADQ